MRMLFLIPVQFMKKNKGQTISILFSMILSITMIVSVSCLIHSAHMNQTESDRELYGDYHYYLLGDDELVQNILECCKNEEYFIQNIQLMQIKSSIQFTDSLSIVLSYADNDCRAMIKREIIEGEYPVNENEIAMDRYTLRAIGAEDTIGNEIVIGEDTFILSGIVREPIEIDDDVLEVFVSDNYQNVIHANMIYLKFDEDMNFYDQVINFVNKFSIDETVLESNGVLINDVIDGNIQRLINTIKATVEDPKSNFITLLMKLKEDFHLTSGLITGMLAIFSIFIIYSIFHISTSKRLKEYSILQTIGVGRKTIGFMLVIELFILLLVSFPLGVILGIFIDKQLFYKVSTLFSGKIALIENTHSGSIQNVEVSVDNIISEMFYVDKSAIIYCAVFMMVLLILLSVILSGKIYKMTIVEMMNEKTFRTKVKKIYSYKNKSLLRVLTNRFMFCSFKNLAAIVFSLAIGGVLILATNYIAINSRMNNEMVMHSQDSVAADVKVSVGKEEKFNYGITQTQLEQIKNLSGITSVSAFYYYFGEIPIEKSQLNWKEFWPEIAGDSSWKQASDIMNRFHGIITENAEGYKIKTNLYGYDDNSLNTLNDYVLDGEIDTDKMKSEHGVVLRTIVDAQNNVGGLDIKAGDTIIIKTLKDINADKDLVCFEGAEELYQEKEFKVLAIVGNSLVNNTEYIGNQGLDVIMTNEQMEEIYQLENYNMLMIEKKDENETRVVSQIQNVLLGMSNIKIVDNSLSIQAKNAEIRRAEILLYSISVLLLVIALFNIINTMFHLLDARRYSFAVLRAMGITENDFYKMLLIQALKYATLTCIVILLIYFGIIQSVIGDTLRHVYGYINQLQGVSVVVVLLVFCSIVIMFVASVMMVAGRILKLNVINELKK